MGPLTYEGHDRLANIKTVAWSPDGRLIASGDDDKTVQVWEATSGKLLLRYQGHSNSVYAVAWSPDGRLLASGSSGGSVQVWEATSGKELLRYEHHTLALAWLPDGRLLAAGDDDYIVNVWEVANENLLFTYRGHSTEVNSVAWSPDGERIASAAYEVNIW